jgi:hypothetical protein
MGSATQKAKPRREAASEPGSKRVSNSCRGYRCLKGFAFFGVFRGQEDYPQPILGALKRYKSYNGVWIFAIVTL